MTMTMDSWNDFYRQIWREAAQSRGTATHLGGVPGAAPPTLPEWPRTTGADAIAIASFVDSILGEIPLRPGGYGVARLWQSAVIELEGLAFAEPAAEYPHNRMLWSTLLAVAAYLATLDAPLPDDDAWDALLATIWSPAADPSNASEPTVRVITASTAEKMWDAQHADRIKVRGFDVRETPPGVLGRPMQVPRTTNADVLRLADYWGQQLAQLQLQVMLGKIVNPMGFEGEQARWQAVMADVRQYARPDAPNDVYPKNHELWRETLSLATTLGVLGEVPSAYELAAETGKQVIGRIADAAGTVAHAIGNIAHEAGAGLLWGVGKPLVIGGGALLALYLLFRGGRRDREAA